MGAARRLLNNRAMVRHLFALLNGEEVFIVGTFTSYRVPMADVIPLRVRRDSVLCFARLKDTRTCPQRDLCNVGVRYHLAANTSRTSTVLTFKKAQAHTTGIMEATARHLSLARYALPLVLNAPSESAPPPVDIEPRRIIPKSVGGYYDGVGSDSETLGHGLQTTRLL